MEKIVLEGEIVATEQDGGLASLMVVCDYDDLADQLGISHWDKIIDGKYRVTVEQIAE